MDLKFYGLKKTITNKFKKNLKTPNKSTIIAYEDMNLRIPEVAFYGEGAITNTIEYLGIVQSYIRKLPLIKESTITFSVSIEYGDLILTISCITNKNDFLDLLSYDDFIPSNHNDIHNWTSRMHLKITKINNKNHEPQILFLRNKKINIPLVMLSEHEKFIEEDKIFVRFHESNIDNVTGMKLNHKPVMLNAVKNVICDKCNISFFDCKCIHSKLTMDKFEHLGAYWSETTSFPDEIIPPPTSSDGRNGK